MKLNHKYWLLFIVLHFFALTTFAQLKPKAFVGIWELTTVKSNGSLPSDVPPGSIKIFNADGTFTNVQVMLSGSVITHSGNYVVNNGRYYTEMVKKQPNGGAYDLAGKSFKIKYVFGPDKKTITLDGYVDGKNGHPGLTYTEVWRKL